MSLDTIDRRFAAHRCSARCGRRSVFAEMRKLDEIRGRPFGLRYYRDLRSREVDFVSESAGALSFLKCKSEESPGAREARKPLAPERRAGGRRWSLAARRTLRAGPSGDRLIAGARGCCHRSERPAGDPRRQVAARGVNSSPSPRPGAGALREGPARPRATHPREALRGGPRQAETQEAEVAVRFATPLRWAAVTHSARRGCSTSR